MKTKFKTAKELMKKPYLRREDFPDDLWTAVENYFVADTVLDEYREKYGDDLVDLAIDCGPP